MRSPVNLIMCVLMIATAVTTVLATPDTPAPVLQSTIRLADMFPEKIGDWKIDPYIVPLQVSPEMQKQLNELYNQTLARTYVNDAGEHVMLSVAYGGDQHGNLALHKPENCYGTQGFIISGLEKADFVSGDANFPVTRLVAVQGNRNEAITYWSTVGDKVIRNGIEQKLQKLRYAMTGKIPDGILVRVSAIDRDTDNSYRIQNAFIKLMLASMKAQDRDRIVGKVDS
jgi:EpsI family protein